MASASSSSFCPASPVIIPDDSASNIGMNTDLSSVSGLGLTRRGKPVSCYIFEEQLKETFRDWWSLTRWFGTNPKKRLKVRWGSKKSATYWEYYHEGAETGDGIPRVVCQRCDKVLVHPSLG